ncbi:MAG: hypothetical protein QF570_07270 [Myxococcota bacterium]|nr:hypothetical protein [Myxococcota bacterium]
MRRGPARSIGAGQRCYCAPIFRAAVITLLALVALGALTLAFLATPSEMEISLARVPVPETRAYRAPANQVFASPPRNPWLADGPHPMSHHSPAQSDFSTEQRFSGEVRENAACFSYAPRQNMRPGVLDRLGLSYDGLSEARPDITILSSSAVGATCHGVEGQRC